MTDRIGPTFSAELAAAACPLDGLNYDPTTGAVISAASDAQRALFAQVLAAHDPTKQPPRTATAKQVRYALNDLGVRTAWDAAVAAGSQNDQDYWACNDPIFEENPKIGRWCTAVSLTAEVLFDKAVTE